ncbi:relaxase [Faecalibacterium prausnitzii]|uniref:Relaxase n=1 Tax=Faecalibacterium prausnitzii TaxID=853 RepID=A0A329U3R0_9FIRM|nr:relaxase/mobilization nuclease domain-containing protein [Faecalibacterium prausnitzii]RAW55646.1 relaxase [Faecalibacterium prausnitzii]
MATLKHLGSKNADYGAAEQYLLFEHDEFTMKPVLDENGRLIPREDYRLSTLNCGGEDFAVACMRANLRYEKNQRREDVKSHHYIISFDPRDGPDNGLTVDRAQELGEQFCKEHFPGHQALVCTHPDGHNHSGNIHVHIVINSLRIEEVPFLPYMDRPADTKAGCKHRCTDAAMRYFKSEVMEMCHREGLYQIDLLNGSKNRVTDREYWAQKKGQAALDKQNAPMIAGGITPRQTKFETNKEQLRQTIRAALSAATSFEDFSSLLLREGVTVKESRGRLSYLTPDRTKPITARKLGDDFDRAAVLAVLEQNAARAAEQTATVPEYPRNIRERLQGKKAVQTTPEKDGIQRMVDRAAKRAEGKGAGYDCWAAVHNLKQMAATVAAYGQYGYSPEELDAALVSANADLQDSTAKLKALDAAIREKKELQTQVLAYAKTKPARDGLKAQKTEKARSAYRERHESDFIIADAATRYFRAHGVSKLPSHKALQAEIEQLTAEKNAHYNEYREKKARVKELHTVKSNLSQILQGEKDREKKHEHER